MCGICGTIEFAARPQAGAESLRAATESMADALFHRGPDDGDVWVDAEVGVGVGFRRLAIIDVSPAGRQPMESRSGDLVIAFNGEIYNHAELRRRLGGPFRGRSDTEVLVEAIEAWGLEAALREAVGMFCVGRLRSPQPTAALCP